MVEEEFENFKIKIGHQIYEPITFGGVEARI